MLSLDQLQVGQQATVTAIRGEPATMQRIVEMGLLEGEIVEVLAVAPLGDPIEVLCGANRISLRRKEAAAIQVSLGPSGRT
ncbi:MAG: ferrous iron transport protein A [Gemmataceae bacterium]|nr:ferrous iron transport protein A [Gemmataceae bacterium]